MVKLKINIILFWFITLFILQITFGFKALGTQFNLNNHLNIKEDLKDVTLIDTPERINDQFLFLFIDGLRYDKLLEANTPNIDKLILNGTTFSNYSCILPSYSAVNYAAFVAGSTTNITNVYSNGFNKKFDLPSLFNIIDSNELNKSLITGTNLWVTFLGNFADVVVKINSTIHSMTETEKILNASLNTIPSKFCKIQFITFEDVDGAGHEFGAASEQYIDEIETIDAAIGEIINLYKIMGKLENTTIVLFSDHGHEDQGGHGENKPDQIHATLIITGKGVKNKNFITNELTTINSITPTVLALLGLPLYPSMNGKVLNNYFPFSNKTNAIYKILQAEIMHQQFNASLLKIRALSPSTIALYKYAVDQLQINITQAKAEYALNNFNSSYVIGAYVENYARLYLSVLFNNLESVLQTLKALIIILFFAISAFIIFYLNRKGILKITTDIFEKKYIIPELAGALIAISLMLIIALLFKFGFNAISFNSTQQTVRPILTAYFIPSAVLIFSPWLIYYLLNRKKSEVKNFKGLRNDFLKSSIGSIFFVSIPIAIYIFTIVVLYGPWPSWNIVPISINYSYMIFAVFSSVIYLIATILFAFLYRKNKEIKNAMKSQ